MTDRSVMTPVSKIMELFDGDIVGPNVGTLPRLGGGGYPEDMKGAVGRTVYYPGGSSTLGELNKMVQNAGPMGIAQAGGGLWPRLRQRKSGKQRRLTRRTSRRARRTQRQRKERRAH